MKFTDLFIRRPVLAIVVSCLLLMLGLQGAGQLAVRQFPDVEKSLVAVRTVYPGASARTVQGFVTEPLQRRIAAAEGVEYITSSSDPGVSGIDVHVRLGEDAEEVMTAIIAKVGEAKFELPREVEDPVVTSSFGDDAMMYMAFLSEEMIDTAGIDYVARNIQPELSTLEGVGEAKLLEQWQLRNAGLAEPGKNGGLCGNRHRCRTRRSASRTTSVPPAPPGGLLVRASVDAETDMQSPEDFAGIVVRQDGDPRVRLGDVAELELASADYDFAAYSSGKETVFLSVTPAPGANPLEVAARVKEVVPRLTARMPADLEVFYDSDSSVFIEEALVRGGADPGGGLHHRDAGDPAVPRLAARGADPARHDPAVVDRGAVPCLGDRDSPSTCSRCSRWSLRSDWWWTTPSSWWKTCTAISRTACNPSRPRFVVHARWRCR